MKSYSSIWIHLIWTTKGRAPLLQKSWRISLFKFIKKNALDHGIILDTINGIEDHVHVLVRILPRQKVSDIVKQCKGASSRWINNQHFIHQNFSWQTGYGAISVSPPDIDKVRKYIRKNTISTGNWMKKLKDLNNIMMNKPINSAGF